MYVVRVTDSCTLPHVVRVNFAVCTEDRFVKPVHAHEHIDHCLNISNISGALEVIPPMPLSLAQQNPRLLSFYCSSSSKHKPANKQHPQHAVLTMSGPYLMPHSQTFHHNIPQPLSFSRSSSFNHSAKTLPP